MATAWREMFSPSHPAHLPEIICYVIKQELLLTEEGDEEIVDIFATVLVSRDSSEDHSG